LLKLGLGRIKCCSEYEYTLSYEEALQKDNRIISKIIFFPLYIIFKLFKKWRAWDKWEEETYRKCNNGQEDYDFD